MIDSESTESGQPSRQLSADEGSDKIGHETEVANKSSIIEDHKSVYSRQTVDTDEITGAGSGSVMSNSLSDSLIAKVIGASEASPGERFDAIETLRKASLNDEQRQRLLHYLGDPSRYSGLNAPAMREFMNELIVLFHDSENLGDDYLSVSRDVIFNLREDEVIRDYFLQGLSRGYENATEAQAATIRKILWANLSEEKISLPGTSLHALNRVRKAGELSESDTAELAKHLGGYIRDGSAYELTRISAMQVAAEMNLNELNPELKEIVLSDKTTVPERVSALSALTKLGDTSLLPEMLQSDEPLMARVAIRLAERQR